MESTFNVAHLVQGQTNKSVLTSEGVLRAKKLSFALKEKYPHAEGLFSSDLVRARQTANELALPYSHPECCTSCPGSNKQIRSYF
jgi:broad specificity phosphatase PhoE